MPLEEYRKKRDFRKTEEPSGEKTTRPPGERRSFVVQQHKARTLHYDLRLEWKGVLKSWAVPKGPSDNPDDKRLAVQVEDHPLDYADFEGVIPQGEYGAGSVLVWDRGTWEPEGSADPEEALERGSLKFVLHGKKLQGRWALARMGGSDGKNWLLIKHKDASASSKPGRPVVERAPRSVQSERTIGEVAEESMEVFSHGVRFSKLKGAEPAKELPLDLKPELAFLSKLPPRGDEWLHELKYDGYRILARKEGGTIRLLSRNEKDWTARFQPVAKALQSLAGDAVLDGEIVVVDEQGRSSFQSLQRQLKEKKAGRLAYFVFDLPWFQGHDLRGVALEERKEVLRQLLDRSFPGPESLIRFSDHQKGKGELFFQRACQAGVEGIVSKRAGSKYIGRRTRDWLKLKCGRQQEFVIGGFTEPEGSRIGFGALLLGYYETTEEENAALRYAGRVGTGFDDAMLRDLHAAMRKIEAKTSPFSDALPKREIQSVTWLQPRLVAEVTFGEWTEDGRLRHPSFLGLREDKEARDVRREDPDEGVATKPAAKEPPPSPSKETLEIAGVAITHPERAVFPDAGVTKGQVARYYHDVASLLLPFVADRPLSVVRCPEGRLKPCFYQKHHAAGMPASVGKVWVEEGGSEAWLTVNSEEGLVALAQFGVIEIHPWLSRNDRLDRPDVMVFDLDPGDGVPWEEVLGAAVLLRDRLRELDLESFPKLTGGKGLHVVVPLRRLAPYSTVKPAAKAVAELLQTQNPERFLTKATKAKRAGKIYVDYLRNGRGATAVAPFSLRARPGAPVAVPVAWEEIKPGLKADAFSIQTLARWIARQTKEPWKGFFPARQSLTKSILRKLGLATEKSG